MCACFILSQKWYPFLCYLNSFFLCLFHRCDPGVTVTFHTNMTYMACIWTLKRTARGTYRMHLNEGTENVWHRYMSVKEDKLTNRTKQYLAFLRPLWRWIKENLPESNVLGYEKLRGVSNVQMYYTDHSVKPGRNCCILEQFWIISIVPIAFKRFPFDRLQNFLILRIGMLTIRTIAPLIF